MECEKVKPSALVVQTLSTLSIAYLTSLTGFIYAWPSYTVLNFMSNGTVLSAPMDSMEISLVGSLTNIGALCVTPFCGYAADTLGRKYAAMLFGLPFVLAWAIISVTTSVPLVLASTGLAGIGAAGQAVTSIYIGEISQDSIRGGLASTAVSGFFFGLLLSYTLGGYLTYHQVVYVHLTLSVLYIVLLMLLRESPVFLLQRGKEEEAAISIAFYRQVSVTAKEVEVEIQKIKLQLDPRLIELLQSVEEADPEASKTLMEKHENDNKKQNQSSIKFLMKSESSKRALLAVLIVMSTTIMMGSIVLQVYAEPLFKEAVPSMSPSLCAILLAVVYLLASGSCAFVVDRCGRKPLFSYTAAISGFCTFLLGTQLQFHWAPHWCTAMIIYIYCFIYTLGAATVPFILTAEVFLPEVRGLCNSISMACMWIMNFVTLIIFNPLVDKLGLGPVFYGFSIVCFVGASYGQFCLPETKGLSADAIQLRFLNKNRNKK